MANGIDIDVGQSLLVGPQGPQGERGPAGSIASDTQPETTDAVVWVDTSVDTPQTIDYTEVTALKTRYENLIKNQTSQSPSDAEIVDARGRYSLLGNRINDLATKKEVQAVASGSPLVASSVSEMADTTRVYVNTTDGNWYYYNGSAWTIGGVYQGTAINPNDPVILDINKKFDDIGTVLIVSENRFNPSTLQVGKIVGTTGVVTNNSDYSTTDYIEVEPGEKISVYTVQNNTIITPTVKRIVAFDENKNFVANLDGLPYSETPVYVEIPNNAKYILVSCTVGVFTNSTIMISGCDGINMPSEIIEYFDPHYELNGYATQEDLDDINSVLFPLKNKKWACIGDSLTEENVATTKHYYDYIKDICDIIPLNYGVGGSGYARRNDENKAFYQRVLNINSNIDIATVFGSGNDLNISAIPMFEGKTFEQALGNYTDSEPTTICGCVNKFLDNYYSVCPTAPIGIIAPSPWQNTPTIIPGNNMELYVEKLEQIAKYRGVPFLDLYHYSNLRPEDVTNRNACFYNTTSLDGNGDGVHPNELGHKILASKIYEFVKTLII